jgi:hypothetical protein
LIVEFLTEEMLGLSLTSIMPAISNHQLVWILQPTEACCLGEVLSSYVCVYLLSTFKYSFGEKRLLACQ